MDPQDYNKGFEDGRKYALNLIRIWSDNCSIYIDSDKTKGYVVIHSELAKLLGDLISNS